jgi:sugar lactone lactonase YvrE
VTPDLVADLGLELGEGPIWDAATGTLIFVDSMKGLILRLDPASGDVSRIEVGPVLGAAIPRSRGGFVASSVEGLLAVDPDGSHSLLVPIEQDRPDSRMNDAKCDSRGRLFSGTLSIPFVRGGNAFYSVDARLALTRQADGVTVSNGIAWNADETLLYYVDTASRGIDMFDYDLATGTIANRRRFVDIDRADGFPDGIAVDADGHVWVALYMGGAVRRYAPDGRLAAQIALPVSGVTSCNFGGADLTDLYITTARHGVSAERLADEPHAGALFRCRPGVTGLQSHEFAG